MLIFGVILVHQKSNFARSLFDGLHIWSFVIFFLLLMACFLIPSSKNRFKLHKFWCALTPCDKLYKFLNRACIWLYYIVYDTLSKEAIMWCVIFIIKQAIFEKENMED